MIVCPLCHGAGTVRIVTGLRHFDWDTHTNECCDGCDGEGIIEIDGDAGEDDGEGD